MRIVLWDLDGTLVDTGGAGMRALARAVDASDGGKKALERLKLGGMTDRAIVRHLCAAHEHHERPHTPMSELERAVTEEEIDAVIARYLAHLRETVPASDGYRLLPGVVDLLDELSPLVVHALATGNVEEGARIKLEKSHIWDRFAFGGFGSDAETRADMLRAARKKADVYLKRRCMPDEFVVVGDTPRDIHAAHEVGFACVAVASGQHAAEELRQAGADEVIESLEDPRAMTAILTASR